MAKKTEILGLSTLANGNLSRSMCLQLNIGKRGCAYRGTTSCHTCPFAAQIAKTCNYQCDLCIDRFTCPCGQTGQEANIGH